MYNLTRVYGNFAALCPSFNQKKRRGSSAVQVRMGREEHRSANGLTIKHSYVVLMFWGSFAARILAGFRVQQVCTFVHASDLR